MTINWHKDPQARLTRKNAFDASLVIGGAQFNRETGRLTSKKQPFLWAIDPETNLLQADLLRFRHCPVCEKAPEKCLFIKDGFRHILCLECGTIYVSLILREDVAEKYWREESAWQAVLNSQPQQELDRLKYQYGLDLVDMRTPGRRLLDIGSGQGHFVRLAEEQNWQTTALELNLESTKKLADEGLNVIVKHLEMTDLPPASFDCITLWEVLEHLPEPRHTMAEVRRLLAPEGLCLIMVPNAHSLVTRLLHEKSNTFGGHSHLNHFSPPSLSRLLESQGLVIEELETVITELDTINNHLSFADPYGGEAEPFWEALTPECLHQNLWGSRLLAVVRKPSA